MRRGSAPQRERGAPSEAHGEFLEPSLTEKEGGLCSTPLQKYIPLDHL